MDARPHKHVEKIYDWAPRDLIPIDKGQGAGEEPVNCGLRLEKLSTRYV
jgi:hypothetical protein